MSQGQPLELVRAMGRWTLAALVLNSVIGSGIFGLPAIIEERLGRWSPLGYLIVAAGMGLVMACFAEVASRFREAGGPYLYAREAFGRFAGIQMGWLSWVVRLPSGAASVSLFGIYLGEFWPAMERPLPRALALAVLVGFVAFINYRGVTGGARLSNIFTIGKLVPLLTLAVAGLVYIVAGGHFGPGAGTAAHHPTYPDWYRALLLLVFVYGGFETAVMPLSEAKNPERDAPVALFTALATVTLLYTVIQIIVNGVLPDPTGMARPLAAAGRAILGSPGAALMTAGALISTYGLLSAQMVGLPRLTYALAARGDFPRFFGAVHPRFRTPYVSIVIFAVMVWAMAATRSFTWIVELAAYTRLFAYAGVCAAMIALRRKQPDAPALRLPAGHAIGFGAIAFTLWMVTGMPTAVVIVLAVTAAAATLNWLVVRKT